MQANQTSVIWTIVVCSLVLLIVGLFAASNVNNNLKLIDVDEGAIATAVLAGIVIPEVTIPEVDTEAIDELWEGFYSDKIETLEGLAEEAFDEQFLDDNDRGVGEWFYKDDVFSEDSKIYELVTDGIECDGDCVVKFVKEYKDDYEIEVINLGLDEIDDRLVELSTVIRVKVLTDEDDPDEYFFDKVYIDSTVTSDDTDLEAEVTYTL